MKLLAFRRWVSQYPPKLPLRFILAVPFVLQTVGTVALVGYLSYRSGQRAVDEMAHQLMEEVGDRVELYLDQYLKTPPLINRINADAVRFGYLNPQNLPQLERYLFQQLQQFNSVTSILFANPAGDFRGADRFDGDVLVVSNDARDGTYSLYWADGSGDRTKLRSTLQTQPGFKHPWYKVAVAAGQPTWSPIFHIGTNVDLAVNAARPVYDPETKELIGVFSVNLMLTQISNFLSKLKVSPSAEIFIVEPDGRLIATSTSSSVYLPQPGKADFQRMLATNSSHPLIQAASLQIKQSYGEFYNIQTPVQEYFQFEDQFNYLQVIPFEDEYGLNWFIVTVVPDSDFIAAIQQNAYTTLWLCGVTLLTSIGLGLFAAQWITKPILKLNAAAKQMAAGNLDVQVNSDRTDELGELSRSFNQMALQTQGAVSGLRMLNQALADSENRLKQILETLPIGVTMHRMDGSIAYINSAGKQLLGIGETDEVLNTNAEALVETYHLYRSGTAQPYPTHELPALRALQGERLKIDDLELHRQGEVVPLEVNSTPMVDSQGHVIASINTFQDITQRRKVERVLVDYHRQLEAEVAERTEALRQNEIRLGAILKAIPDLMALINREGFYLASIRSNTILDIVPSHVDPVGKNVSEILPPEIAGRQLESIHRALATQEVQIYEQEVQFENRLQYEEVRAVPCDDNTVMFMIRDITARKQAEAALRQSEERLREIAETVSQFFFVRSATSGKYLYISPAYERIWGRTCKSLHQHPESWLEAIHPDDRTLVTQSLVKQFQNHAVQREYRIIRPNQEIRWIRADVSLIRDESGAPLRFVGIAEDITVQKQVELALRNSQQEIATRERLLNAFFEAASLAEVGLCIQDDQLRYLRINQALATANGLSVEAHLGKTTAEILPQFAPTIETHIRQVLATGQPLVNLEMSGILPNQSGVLRHWLVSYFPISTDSNADAVVGSIVIEITDRKRVEEAAEAANRAKSAFLANMSHELRTPLNAILGFAQLMARHSPVTPLQQQHLETINRNGEYLLQLINDVLSISKIEAGRITLEQRSFNLFALLDTLEGMFRLRSETKGLSFSCHHTAAVPQYIHTDERKLRQIITNLLDNAIKFTQQGRVTLRVSVTPAMPSRPQTPTLCFEVEDTGVGIAETELDSIFDAFVQADAGRRSQQGTGLGLVISRKFAQLLGGELRVRSELGQGSCFNFQVPIQLADAEGIELRQTSHQAIGFAPGQPHYRILVVDDTDTNRQLIVRWLSEVGCTVQQASNGQEAVEQWKKFEPHLIWMDMRMPVMDGYEAVRQIRQRETQRQSAGEARQATKIIAVTTAVFEEERQMILTVGCDDFVSKPCSETVIFDKLAEHLNVQYVYAARQTEKTSPSSSTLNPAALCIMPPEWIVQLNHAARSANERIIFELLEAIPTSHQELKQALIELVHNFQLEHLIHLTQSPNL